MSQLLNLEVEVAGTSCSDLELNVSVVSHVHSVHLCSISRNELDILIKGDNSLAIGAKNQSQKHDEEYLYLGIHV
ncbi:hypothetical protein D3C80_1900660 [compost metagenome]